MKHLIFPPSALLLLASVGPARAVDHDGIDAGRPLDFDDAETIAFREKALEFGGALARPRGGKFGLEAEAEFLFGFARNWQAGIGLDPSYMAESGGKRRVNIGDVELSVQHNLNRETEKMPAFGLRADAFLPTGRGSRGTDFRFRGIASRQFGAYGRLHFNADLGINNRPSAGERRTVPGAIVGYSVPLGYPVSFNRTLVSQIGWRTNPERGEKALLNVGVGIRQQVTPRSVFDVGIKTDIAGSGDARERFRLVAGYSTAF